MSTLKKIYDKINNSPKELSFEQIHNFLINEKIGFEYRVSKSSHYQYKKGGVVFTLPRHGKTISGGYIDLIAEKLEEAGIEVKK